ncbi:hypothetical protein HX001_14915 [Empedobacter brevis]|uniref:Uncharacterized protein n=1 Tax=Empedobacter brevis TaxID=247 RepID=A0AAJ1QGQ3_9FLAO|nr:hypothetical protein [Empedobacter brevis]MDM1073778.1 hypothetical protein [Empedobacter brevis]QHC85077.1 hypothetical protein AS589_09955 [Empedobacter brevis]
MLKKYDNICETIKTKPLKGIFFFILLFFFFIQNTVAQTLSKGDIVFLGVNSDNSCGNNTDEFIYLLFLKDVKVNEKFYITDNRWNNSKLFTNEGKIEFKKTGSSLPKGSIIKITINSSTGIGTSIIGWSIKKVNSSNPFAINNSGDQVFIVNNISDTPTFLAGFNTKRDWDPKADGLNSLLPTSLTDIHQSNSNNSNNRYRHYIGGLNEPLSKGEWIVKILNSNNWKNDLTNNIASCNIFNDYTKNNFDNKKVNIIETTVDQEICEGDFIHSIKVIIESNIVNYKWYRSVDNVISNNDVLVAEGSNLNEYTPNTVGDFYYYCIIYIDLPLNNEPNNSIFYNSNMYKVKINPLPKIAPIEMN